MNPKSVTIAGKSYPLRFEFASLIAMEEQHGVNVFRKETFTPSPKLSCVLIWGAVLHAAPEITLAQVAAGIPLPLVDKAGADVLDLLMTQLRAPVADATGTPTT